jgi:hypothetical protein
LELAIGLIAKIEDIADSSGVSPGFRQRARIAFVTTAPYGIAAYESSPRVDLRPSTRILTTTVTQRRRPTAHDPIVGHRSPTLMGRRACATVELQIKRFAASGKPSHPSAM